MKIKTILNSLILFNFYGLASARCIALDPTNIQVTWTAFKTPMRLGVTGRFKTMSVTSPKDKILKGQSISELLSGVVVEFDLSSIDSGMSNRDANILNTFFTKSAPAIKAKVVAVDQKEIKTDLLLGGKLGRVQLRYQQQGNELEAYGFIDVFDYGMNQNLADLNKQCFALHEGKTWSDVRIDIKASLSECSP